RWIRCQSVVQPSSAEYWHIGAMTIRLASSRSPTRSGVNSALMLDPPAAPISAVSGCERDVGVHRERQLVASLYRWMIGVISSKPTRRAPIQPPERRHRHLRSRWLETQRSERSCVPAAAPDDRGSRPRAKFGKTNRGDMLALIENDRFTLPRPCWAPFVVGEVILRCGGSG